ncbi:DinB family protein [Ornithinibacillus xuwenensis]|uniref:DinB family protein n=1 Tax=Ornithinibacillus xuwenensis TaxID=3144668 RepID=A0ABU9XCT3_9BACI
MIHAKTVLLDQLLANANDRSWYVSFQESVEGISDKEAKWKPDGASHSITEIVQHLIYWNKVWQLRYEKSNVNAVKSIEDNADSFLPSEDQNIAELKEELLKILLRWQDLITERKLESSVNGFPVKAEWWALIGNTATHNAYHIGQIAYIRKMKKDYS